MLDFKRIITIVIIILLIIGVTTGIYFYINKDKDKQEIIPQEEISEEQLRQTIVSLYFKSEEKLIPEARLIDVKELLENPYKTIIEMLIEGPKSEKLERTIPEGTKINKIEKKADTLIIDFSKEFIENHKGDEMQEKLTINSIVNTVTELTEINSVRILIDGEKDKAFKDGKINFIEEFKRIST